MTFTAELAHQARATLGEAVTWSPIEEVVLWLDVDRGTVHRFDHRRCTPIDTTVFDGAVGNIAPRAGGGWGIALDNEFALVDQHGEIERRITLDAEPSTNRLNDGAVDRHGRLFQGSMNVDGRGTTGALHRIDVDGTTRRLVDQIAISNGIAWSLDQSTMYYIDTMSLRVDQFDYEAETGEIAGRRPLISFDGSCGYPDGMCVDADGCLWVALFDGGRVQRFSPDGKLVDQVLVDNAPQTTCCGFGGPDLDRLYVTTARLDLNPATAAAPLAGSLFVADVDAVGLAVNLLGL